MNIEIKRYIYIHNMYKHSKNKATENNKQDKKNKFYKYGNDVCKIIKGWDGCSY